MPKIVTTRDFVFNVLKGGIRSVDAGQVRTATRVLQVEKAMTEQGTLSGNIGMKVGWSPGVVNDVQVWIQEFRAINSELVGEEKAHRLNWVPGAIVEFVRQIREKMWVPEPDDIPLDFIGPGSGFRSLPVGARHLTWQQENGIPVRCWVTDDEDERLRDIFRLLEEQDQENQTGDKYDRLQNAAVDYINKTRRYLWRAYMDGDFVPIPKLRAAILGGQGVNVSRDQFATSYELMNELPRLRGLAEEFSRDLEVAIAGLNAWADS